MSDERAMRLKVQELHGRHEGKYGRYKRERIASYPAEATAAMPEQNVL